MNKDFVAARNHNMKRNKTGFILHACDSPPLNSHVKRQVLNFVSTLCFIASSKNNKQNIWENIVQCWVYETSIKFSRLIKKNPIPTFVNYLPPKSWCWFPKTNTVMYYFNDNKLIYMIYIWRFLIIYDWSFCNWFCK